MIITRSPLNDDSLTVALTRTLATSRAPGYLRAATTTPWDRAALKAALIRFLATSTPPKYLRDAATLWLARQPRATRGDT